MHKKNIYFFFRTLKQTQNRLEENTHTNKQRPPLVNSSGNFYGNSDEGNVEGWPNVEGICFE